MQRSTFILFLFWFCSLSHATDSTISHSLSLNSVPYRTSYVLVDEYKNWVLLDANNWPRCPLYIWPYPGCANGYTPSVSFTLVDSSPYVRCQRCTVGDIDKVNISMTIKSFNTNVTYVQFCGHTFFETGHKSSSYYHIHFIITCSANAY